MEFQERTPQETPPGNILRLERVFMFPSALFKTESLPCSFSLPAVSEQTKVSEEKTGKSLHVEGKKATTKEKHSCFS